MEMGLVSRRLEFKSLHVPWKLTGDLRPVTFSQPNLPQGVIVVRVKWRRRMKYGTLSPHWGGRWDTNELNK